MLPAVQGGGGLKHATFTTRVGLVVMPGLNSTAAVFQPTVIQTLCNSNNKIFLLLRRKNKPDYLWQNLYPSYKFKMVFPSQRIAIFRLE